jgi:hypothetical protein
MAKSSRPRKPYRPRATANVGGLFAVARIHARAENRAPLDGDQLTDLGAAYWLSFDNLRKFDANEESWSCVVCALNIGMALAETGIGAEYEADIVKALDGAFRAKVRSARTGNFRLDGEALQAIEHALDVHDSQMELATRKEVTAAMELVRRRIDEDNVYTVPETLPAYQDVQVARPPTIRPEAEIAAKRCERKRRHPDEIAARVAAMQAIDTNRNVSVLYVYKCDVCAGWHLTKQKGANGAAVTAENPVAEAA